jgi:uncharacterized protein YbjQ (UPF0145 family)
MPPPAGGTQAEIREAVRQLATGGRPVVPGGRESVTSDLSIDESLILHSIGWEPLELVSGVGSFSVPYGVWNWGAGEITGASDAHHRALDAAQRRLAFECQRAGGYGAVGVRVEIGIERHFINAVLVGTAVAPSGNHRAPAAPFASDLSGRDFALLHRGGWDPVGLAFGASFVYVPRRGIGATLRQTSQNVELTNYTEALYAAREAAMERMQASAEQLGGAGVVGVRVSEGPMPFARHAIRFTAWGTVVRQASSRPSALGRPRVVVPLEDLSVAFEATSLRGG